MRQRPAAEAGNLSRARLRVEGVWKRETPRLKLGRGCPEALTGRHGRVGVGVGEEGAF